jgi:hypothetical protein
MSISTLLHGPLRMWFRKVIELYGGVDELSSENRRYHSGSGACHGKRAQRMPSPS